MVGLKTLSTVNHWQRAGNVLDSKMYQTSVVPVLQDASQTSTDHMKKHINDYLMPNQLTPIAAQTCSICAI